MTRRTRMVTAAALVSMAAMGCASMQAQPKMTAEEAIATRQKLMKSQGEAWKNIQDKTKAGDVAGVVPEAQKLVDTSHQIPALFPEGSLGPTKTAAKPEIWQKWPEFEAAAKNLENRSATLRDQAMAKDGAAVTTTVASFGRDACGTCHTPFRVPPPQQQPAQPRS
jgi:cytochrome c556